MKEITPVFSIEVGTPDGARTAYQAAGLPALAAYAEMLGVNRMSNKTPARDEFVWFDNGEEDRGKRINLFVRGVTDGPGLPERELRQDEYLTIGRALGAAPEARMTRDSGYSF
jgi:hypothetical protein